MAATYLAGRYNQRAILVIVLLLPGALGGALMSFLPPGAKAGKLVGNYLTNCIGAALPLLYAWVACNFAGHTKKVTMNAILLMSFCLGNIIGPETFKNKDAPDYIPAKVAIVATTLGAVALVVALRFLYQWENARRERNKDSVVHHTDEEFMDLTDRENQSFRVCLAFSCNIRRLDGLNIYVD